MKERKRIRRHPWQGIAKPFAFRAWRNRSTERLEWDPQRIERAWKARHPECVQ